MVCLECAFSHTCPCNTHTHTRTPRRDPVERPGKLAALGQRVGENQAGRASWSPRSGQGHRGRSRHPGHRLGPGGLCHTSASAKSGPPGTLPPTPGSPGARGRPRGGPPPHPRLSRSAWAPMRRPTATLFITGPTWTRRRPLGRPVWCIRAVEYYLTMKKDEPQIHAPAARNLQDITLRAKSQAQERTCRTVPRTPSSRAGAGDARELLGVTEMASVLIRVVAVAEVSPRDRSRGAVPRDEIWVSRAT